MLLIGVFAGFFGELCGCDKQPLRGALTGQGTDKLLNFRATDGSAAVPTLGLNVNQAEAQFIFPDQAVNAFVSGLANYHSGILGRAAIPHLRQKLNNEVLEKGGGLPHDGGEQIVLQNRIDLVEGSLQRILGCLAGNGS